MGAGDEHPLPLIVINQRRQHFPLEQLTTRKSPWYATRKAELEWAFWESQVYKKQAKIERNISNTMLAPSRTSSQHVWNDMNGKNIGYLANNKMNSACMHIKVSVYLNLTLISTIIKSFKTTLFYMWGLICGWFVTTTGAATCASSFLK